MDWKFLKIETPEEGICILTISHPQSLNALSRPVLEEMYRFVTDIPEGTAVLIIRGDGPKSFVAGADISQMAGFDAEQGLDFGHTGDSRRERLCPRRRVRAGHGLRHPHCL